MAGLRRTPLRLLIGGRGTSRRRTWGYHLGSCEQVGSEHGARISNVLLIFLAYMCTKQELRTLPFRSRKKSAEAMVAAGLGGFLEDRGASYRVERNDLGRRLGSARRPQEREIAIAIVSFNVRNVVEASGSS